MVHWWILGSGFLIDTGDHWGCTYGHSKKKINVLTVRSVFSPNDHIYILRGFLCQLESLRLKFSNEPSIFCRWGLGWVDKAQCFRLARRFGAAGSSLDFFMGFSRHGASWPLSGNLCVTYMISGCSLPAKKRSTPLPALPAVEKSWGHYAGLFPAESENRSFESEQQRKQLQPSA